jgi:hypothetical protein
MKRQPIVSLHFEMVKPGVPRGMRKLDVPWSIPLVRSVLA